MNRSEPNILTLVHGEKENVFSYFDHAPALFEPRNVALCYLLASSEVFLNYIRLVIKTLSITLWSKRALLNWN